MAKAKIDVDDVMKFLNDYSHCSYDGDCMADISKCKDCSDYVIDYSEACEWLKNLTT